MDNKMEEIARMFGKELEEEFEIKNWYGSCRFTEQGIMVIGEQISTNVLHALLTGGLKIKWKPKSGEKHYFVFSRYPKPQRLVYYNESISDRLMLKRGMITRTEEEAIQIMKDMGWWEE